MKQLLEEVLKAYIKHRHANFETLEYHHLSWGICTAVGYYGKGIGLTTKRYKTTKYVCDHIQRFRSLSYAKKYDFTNERGNIEPHYLTEVPKLLHRSFPNRISETMECRIAFLRYLIRTLKD